MIEENSSLDDDDDDLQKVPSGTFDSDTMYDTSVAQSMGTYSMPSGNNHGSSPKFIHRGSDIKGTGDQSLPMEWSGSGGVTRKKQLLKDEHRAQMCDEQNELDQSCSNNSPKRHCAKNNGTHTDPNPKYKKEIIERKFAYFPKEYGSSFTLWYSYRINVSGNPDLGFIAPYKLPILSAFYLYKNEDAPEVRVEFLRQIDYRESGNQLQYFSQYILNDIIMQSNSRLNFDLTNAPLKLLICFLTKSGELDYQRMNSVCGRKNRPIRNCSELNDQEVYSRSDVSSNTFYTATGHISSQGSPKVNVKHMEKPKIDYLKKPLSSTSTAQTSPSPEPKYCRINVLCYALLNRNDLELISKLPSILVRISQLLHIELLRKKIANTIRSHSLRDISQMPVVTFGDCLSEILSSNQSTVLPLDSLNYDLLLRYNGELQLSTDLLFQSITTPSAKENSNMKALATIGDSFLGLVVAIRLYHQYPLDDTNQLSPKRDKQVHNKNLNLIATEQGLKSYLNTTEVTLCGSSANWLPPGFVMDQENSSKYLEQKFHPKAPADMIEALIGAVLVSTGYSAAIQFIQSLGLDVIPTHEYRAKPSFHRSEKPGSATARTNLTCKDHRNYSFVKVEQQIKYTFQDKTYLIAAFSPQSHSGPADPIHHRRLSFVGNELLKFLITRYVCVTKKSVTSDHISDVRFDLLDNNSKAKIISGNNLDTTIIYNLQRSNRHSQLTDVDEISPATKKSVNQQAQAFEALIGAIFFDSHCCLKSTWNVIESLIRPCRDLDDAVEHPRLHPRRRINENGGKIINEFTNGNGVFFCRIQLKDGSTIEGSGKSKEIAIEDASKKCSS